MTALDLFPDSRAVGLYLLLTVVVGGWAAWMAARGIARGWRPYRQCLSALLAVAAAVRFLAFALFGENLLSIPHLVLDAATIVAIGSLGYRYTRTRQMTRQYPWLYESTGPLTWRARP